MTAINPRILSDEGQTMTQKEMDAKATVKAAALIFALLLTLGIAVVIIILPPGIGFIFVPLVALM